MPAAATRPGEPTDDAAHRRLAEEMGIRCDLMPLFTAQYRAAVSNGYIEDEVVHVFGGTYEGEVAPDPAEVAVVPAVATDRVKPQRRFVDPRIAEPANVTTELLRKPFLAVLARTRCAGDADDAVFRIDGDDLGRRHSWESSKEAAMLATLVVFSLVIIRVLTLATQNPSQDWSPDWSCCTPASGSSIG